MSQQPDKVIDNPWQALRAFTDARIALGRAGSSLPTRPWLEFQLAHAEAQDAVHARLDVALLAQQLASIALATGLPPVLQLQTQAVDRVTYLQRPDLGRRLDADSVARLTDLAGNDCDLAIVIADGLSSLAIQQHAVAVAGGLLTALQNDSYTRAWQVAPIAIVSQGRVACGDEVGQCLRARLVVVLIGERPGLSSPDSLGIYLTWQPRVGITDERRNCISSVRPGGLGYSEAIHKLMFLLTEAHRRQLSGVALKEEAAPRRQQLAHGDNFLVPRSDR